MRLLKSLAVVALVSLASSSALAAGIGPKTPLPGVDPGLWERIYSRADKVARVALKAKPGATEQNVQCLSALLRVLLFRHAQVVDAFRPGAGGKGFWHSHDSLGPEGGPLDFGPTSPDFKPLITDEADPEGVAPAQKQDSSFERIRRDYDDSCRDDDGPGGGARVAWRSWNHEDSEDWKESLEYGPPLVPNGTLIAKTIRDYLLGDKVRAHVAKEYPGADVVGVAERFAQGLSTGQDVERIRRFLGLAGQALDYTAQGFRFAPAGELPFWVQPSESVLPSAVRHSAPNQGL